MRSMLFSIFLSLTLSFYYSDSIHCSPNCMAHRSSLAEPGDPHDYTCHCPCKTVNNGRCVLGCGHRMEVRPLIIIGGADRGKINLNAEPISGSAASFWNGPSEQLQKNIIQNKAYAHTIKHAHAHKQTNKQISRAKLAFLNK